jgi:hypothetical protein
MVRTRIAEAAIEASVVKTFDVSWLFREDNIFVGSCDGRCGTNVL